MGEEESGDSIRRVEFYSSQWNSPLLPFPLFVSLVGAARGAHDTPHGGNNNNQTTQKESGEEEEKKRKEGKGKCHTHACVVCSYGWLFLFSRIVLLSFSSQEKKDGPTVYGTDHCALTAKKKHTPPQRSRAIGIEKTIRI